MADEQSLQYCTTCNQNTLHARPSTNHILHFLITFFSCFLWIPIWYISALKIGGWRCQQCGTKKPLKKSHYIIFLFTVILIFAFSIFVFSEIINWIF